ncbi:hypothetical protein [Halobacillus sp. A5]|uniref:hypothetical protein n=1 Tax=Halobacillus sp. A5 TaxID=2880263 RepID=UPI0020A672A3|nr:hypothetical protein [Halobacillus sp. A5]MCP3028494.1 hypothetical protein [Halobacillus sp. A5]
MRPPENILHTWKKFDDFPMETLTKLWVFQQEGRGKQRSVSLMREHRQRYSMSGNCFDLALWLLDEFRRDGIKAYPIGHHILTEEAHVAVVALDEKGRRFLCDLGDQWLTPILVDGTSDEFSSRRLSGFFPAAEVRVKPQASHVEVFYYRPNSKFSTQRYDLQPIEMDEFLRAANYSQNVIRPFPLVECRIPFKEEQAHWEFDNWSSFLSTSEGLIYDFEVTTVEEWVNRIYEKTRYNKGILKKVLEKYEKLK